MLLKDISAGHLIAAARLVRSGTIRFQASINVDVPIAYASQPVPRTTAAAGYASQAHMNDEVRRLTGTTPVRFLEDAALPVA